MTSSDSALPFCWEAMIPHPLTVSPETPLSGAIAQMSQAQASCVLVVEEERLVGIFTEGDLVRSIAAGEVREGITLGTVMTPSPIASPESKAHDLLAVLNRMREHRISHLPIVDDAGMVVGLITPQSLRQALTPADLLKLRRVGEVMETQVVCAPPQANLLQLVQQMVQRSVPCVVIAEVQTQGSEEASNLQPETQHPIGIVTERDIVQFQVLGLDFQQTQAREIMSTPLLSVHPQDSLWVAHALMKRRNVRRVVVCGHGGELVGAIAQGHILHALEPGEIYDVMQVLQQEVRQLQAEKFALLRERNRKLEKQVEEDTAQIQAQAERERLLATVALRIRQSLNLDTILNTTAAEVRQLLQSDRVLIYRFDPDWSGIVAVESVSQPDWSILGQMIKDACFEDAWLNPYQQGYAKAIEDVRNSDLSPCHIEFLTQFQIRANLVVPILLSEERDTQGERVGESESIDPNPNRLWGLLIVHECSGPRQWQVSEIEFLEQLATQVGIAIQQATLVEKLESELVKRQQREEILRNMALGVSAETGDAFFQSLVQSLTKVLGVEYAFVGELLEPEGNGVWVIACHGDGQAMESFEYDLANTPCANVVAQQLCIYPQQVQQLFPLDTLLPCLEAESYAGMPLFDSTGKALGLIAVISRSPLQDTQFMKEILKIFAIRVSSELERKQAEDALRQSEERLQLALDGSGDGLWDWNIPTGEVYLSQRWLEMLGYQVGELPGQVGTWEGLIHPEDLSWVMEVLNAHLEKSSVPYAFDYRVRTQTGEWKWIGNYGKVVARDENGKPLRMAGLHKDIGDRKQVEEVLRRQAIIFESIHDGVILTDLDGHIIDWNPAAERIFGYSKAEVLGKTPGMLHRPEEAPMLTGQILDRMRREGRWSGEMTFIHKDGTEGICETIVVPLYDRVGQVVASIGVNRDITDRKRTEASLRETQEQLQAILDRSPTVIYLKDAQDCYLLINHQYETLFHITQEQIAGKTDAEVFPAEIAAAFQANDRQVMETGLSIDVEELAPQDDGIHTYLSTKFPLYDATGAVCGIGGISTDITDRKRAEEELKQYRDRLEQLVLARTAELTQTNEQLQQEIQARAQLADALLASEARLAGILDNANDAIISVDEHQQITLFNKGAEKIFGYTAPETIGQPLDLLLPHRFAAIHRQHVQDFGQVAQNSRNMGDRREVFGCRKDGTEFPVEASISKLQLGDQQVLTAILRDISDRKEAEVALRKSQRRYATLAEVSPVGIFRTDDGGNYLYVNERWCKMAGMTSEQAPGSGWLHSIHPDDLDLVFNTWYRAVQSQQPFRLEYRFQRPDGKITWVFGQAVAETDRSGAVIGFVGTVTDISHAKQIEATLREYNRRWRTLLDNVRLVVVGLDLSGKVEYVNPFFLELTGYTQTEVLGKDWFESFLPPSQSLQSRQVFEELLEQRSHPHYQNTILNRSGEERIIAWNNTLLQDDHGELIGLTCIGEDITQRYAIERMKDEFISVVSHELRTPLTSIHGALNLLSTGLVVPNSDRGEHIIQIAAESAKRLVRLVNDILELERLESGKIKLVKQQVNTAELLQNATDQMQVMATRAGVTLEVSNQAIELEADGDRIIQVLTNLLSNAIKFSPKDSIVWLSVERQTPETGDGEAREDVSSSPACVLFSVKDQGRGIPADKLDRIFERFHQVDASDSRQKGGTGLGLAICHSIVEQHGGKIWVESTLDEGSSFYFTLLIQVAEEENHDDEANSGD